MDATFGNAVLLIFQMIGVIAISMTVNLPIILLVTRGREEAVRSLPMAPLIGLMFGAIMIVPAIIGSIFSWLFLWGV